MKIVATISIDRESPDRIEEIAAREDSKLSIIANRFIKSALGELVESEVQNP